MSEVGERDCGGWKVASDFMQVQSTQMPSLGSHHQRTKTPTHGWGTRRVPEQTEANTRGSPLLFF